MILQFCAIIALGATTTFFPISFSGRLLFWTGVAVGLWAIIAMGISNLRIQPEVAKGAILITSGPYRYIRNPMYFSVLSLTLGWVLESALMWRLSLWLGLVTVLIFKLKFEEKLLASAFADYPAYANQTKRLIPGVW